MGNNNYLNGERNRNLVTRPEPLNRAQGLRARWFCQHPDCTTMRRAIDFDPEQQCVKLECGHIRGRAA